MNRIDGNSFSPLSPGLGQAGTLPAKTGNLGGEQVTVKDSLSILADAAEEISLHHSEKAESKKHSERKLETFSHAQRMQIEEITAYLEATQAFDDPAKLAQLAQRMLEAGQNQENPRELARQQSRDPTQQFVLLQHALHEGAAQGSPVQVLERLEDALADLEADHGPEIRAGLNTLGSAVGWGATREAVAQFQQAYRDVVLGDNSLAQTLVLVMERLGGATGDDLERGLQGLIKALGTDLSAARPSIDPNRLQALVQDLYQLEVVSTVLDGCRELAGKLAASRGGAVPPAFDLMKELVAVTGEKWVGASRFTGMADRWGLQDVQARITFQTAVKALLREMPPKVFSDADTRHSIIGAAQEALDDAIDREDA